jgi:hypothetical protein
VYTTAILLSAWLVLSVWLFTGGGLTDYLLFIVSGFIFIVVALQLILWRVGRKGYAKSADKPLSFRDWARLDFETWQGRLSGAQAAALILLPIAAVAFGMTAFGIALRVAEHGVAPPQPGITYSSGSVVKNSG